MEFNKNTNYNMPRVLFYFNVVVGRGAVGSGPREKKNTVLGSKHAAVSLEKTEYRHTQFHNIPSKDGN